jgi:exosortase
MNSVLSLAEDKKLDRSWYVWLPGLTALVAAIYAASLAAMVGRWWTDPGASHGFLIPPLALYFVWNIRHRVLAFPAIPDNRGLFLISAGCLIFLLGKIGVGFFLSQCSLLVLIAGMILTFWGLGRLRVLLFPLVLLATMIPLPRWITSSVALPLQIFASQVSATLAQLLGVTVYQEGNQIQLAQTSLGVAEACSGLHSLGALMVAALLLGAIYCTHLHLRIILFVLSVPIAIGANVLRVTVTAVLADYQPEWAAGFYHSFSSWLIFLVGAACLWAVAKGFQFLSRRKL